MATPEVDPTTDAPPAARARDAERGWRPYRLSVRQFLKMIGAGVFPPEADVELLGGILVEPMTTGDQHDYSMMVLPSTLQAQLPAPWAAVGEISLRLAPRSRPEPDVMVLRGPLTRYRAQQPSPQDVALVIEVSDSTYPYDRGPKWRRYAAAGVPAYWIVNIKKRRVEVYRDPSGAGESPAYGTAEVYGEDAAVPVLIDGVEVGRVAVVDILP